MRRIPWRLERCETVLGARELTGSSARPAVFTLTFRGVVATGARVLGRRREL